MPKKLLKILIGMDTYPRRLMVKAPFLYNGEEGSIPSGGTMRVQLPPWVP